VFIVAGDLQARQADAVAAPGGPHRRAARARVETHLGRMLAFDFAPGPKAWRRASAAQSWYWTRDQQHALGVDLPSPFRPVEKDAGGAIAAVMALYDATFRDAGVMEWTLGQATMELNDRLHSPRRATIGQRQAPLAARRPPGLLVVEAWSLAGQARCMGNRSSAKRSANQNRLQSCQRTTGYKRSPNFNFLTVVSCSGVEPGSVFTSELPEMYPTFRGA
jgi:hypothetical protein